LVCKIDQTNALVNKIFIEAVSIAGGLTKLDTTNRLIVYFNMINPILPPMATDPTKA
jgi:hypothetical protein